MPDYEETDLDRLLREQDECSTSYLEEFDVSMTPAAKLAARNESDEENNLYFAEEEHIVNDTVLHNTAVTSNDDNALTLTNENGQHAASAPGHKQPPKELAPLPLAAVNAISKVDELVTDSRLKAGWALKVKSFGTIARRICNHLKEKKMSLVLRAVRRVGKAVSGRLLRQTLAVEAGGGLPKANGKGRRAPGGVFFLLLRHEASCEDWKFIFEEEKRKKKENRKRVRKRKLEKQKQELDDAVLRLTGKKRDRSNDSLHTNEGKVKQGTMTEKKNNQRNKNKKRKKSAVHRKLNVEKTI
eukprot:g2669.t1